jgi:excisionase family DNA binding protein
MLAYGNASEEQTSASERPSGRDERTRVGGATGLDEATGKWLSINGACEILGVDKSTLRRWSDRGRVPVFRTPGGHRRYSEADLRDVLNGELGARRPIRRRELAALTEEEFRSGCLESAAEHGWFEHCSDDERARMRRLCGQMVDVSVRFASDRGNADRLRDEGQRLAREYGRHMAWAGLGASEVVAVFLHFRKPLYNALRRYIEQENLPVRRSSGMLEQMTGYFDMVLTSIMEAYEASPRT